MFDGLLLSYTYSFLLTLQNKLYMDLYNIKLKFVNYNNESINWTLHSNITNFISYFNNNLILISDTYFSHFFDNYKLETSNISYINTTNFFDKICFSGSYSYIDSIKLINKNLPFDNSFIVFDSFGSIKIQKSIKWNDKQNIFYENEIKRYESLILNLFYTYKTNWYKIKEYRNDKYVDNCYMDIDYVN